MPYAIYLSDNEYATLVASLLFVRPLLKVEPSAWTGATTADEIKLALGEKCNVWPASILPLVEEEDAAVKRMNDRTRSGR